MSDAKADAIRHVLQLSDTRYAAASLGWDAGYRAGVCADAVQRETQAALVPIAWVPVHPRHGPLWSMATSDPSPERLPRYPLMPLYGSSPSEREPNYQQMLGDLLARFFGDGGHYVEQHGWGKACADAEALLCIAPPEKTPSMTWQPIETAPKDGTNVLLVNHRGNMACGHWSDGAPFSKEGWVLRGDCEPNTFFNENYGPSHWMHLPPTPKENYK